MGILNFNKTIEHHLVDAKNLFIIFHRKNINFIQSIAKQQKKSIETSTKIVPWHSLILWDLFFSSRSHIFDVNIIRYYNIQFIINL